MTDIAGIGTCTAEDDYLTCIDDAGIKMAENPGAERGMISSVFRQQPGQG